MVRRITGSSCISRRPIARLGMLFFLWMLVSSCGVRTKVIEVPKEVVRTEYRDRVVRDSVFLSDSVKMERQGDTVYVDRIRWRVQKTIERDTVLRTDTLTQTKVIEVPVQRGFKGVYLWSFIGVCVLCIILLFLTIKRIF